MMRDKLDSENSSYTYEATFAAGSIGINLQPTRSGLGTYVDSFHKAGDSSLLPAELSGYIKLGDIVLEINGEDVSRTALKDIPRILSTAKRPVCIKFERAVLDLTFADTVRDPRKLPWLMQYLVDTCGVEAAISDQAKIYLWLECDQYVHNYSILSAEDTCCHALQIAKKFFNEGTTFSVVDQVSESIKQKIEYLVRAIGDSFSSGSLQDGAPNQRIDSKNDKFHRLFRECREWIEDNMNSVSFKKFLLSTAASRMTGYLVYSPPFEKMTLFGILRCDRKTMYMLAFLSQIKRHTTLYCYNMLRDETALETSVEGVTVEDITGLMEKAYVCAHIFGADISSAGAEDLPMIAKLKEHINISDSSNNFKGPSAPDTTVEYRTVLSPFLDEARSDPSTSTPLREESRVAVNLPNLDTVNNIRQCLVALRNSMLRQLVQDLTPKFFASKEFEILLWELNDSRDKIGAAVSSESLPFQRFSSEFEDDDSVGSEIRGPDIGGVVPNGAIQRLVRKIEMPEAMTMHRAPVALLEEIKSARLSTRGDHSNPLCWLASFDTDFSGVHPEEVTKVSSRKLIGPKICMSSPVPIAGLDSSDVNGSLERIDSSMIPRSIVDFFIPSGKILWEKECSQITFSNQSSSKTAPSSKLFNFTVAGGGNAGLLYVAAVVDYRQLDTPEQEKWEAVISSLTDSDASGSPSKLGLSPGLSPFPETTPRAAEAPSSVPGKMKSSVSDENLQLKIGISPGIFGSGSSPKEASGVTALNNIKGKVDKITSSPFFEKFKGITPPSIFRAQQSTATPASAELPKEKLTSQTTRSSVHDTTPIDKQGGKLGSSSIEAPIVEAAASINSGSGPSVSLVQHYDDPIYDPPFVPPPTSSEVDAQNTQTGVVIPESNYVSTSEPVSLDGMCPGTELQSKNSVQVKREHPYRCAANGFCIVSKFPSIDALRQPVYDILRSASNSASPDSALSLRSMSSERLVELGEATDAFGLLRRYVAQVGQLDPAVLRSGGAVDFNSSTILRNINPKNLVALYFGLILEQKIVVISSKLTALTCLGEFLRESLVPFHWNHVYVPVLPKKISGQILDCPTPFFVGIQRDFFDAKAVPSDVCVVDLDHDACRMSPELARALKAGRRILRSLDNILRPAYVSCDNLHPNAFCVENEIEDMKSNMNISQGVAERVLGLLKCFSGEILFGIHECGMSCIDHDEVVVLFDEAMFLAFKNRRAGCSLLPSDDSFLKPLLRTQAFSVAATTVVLKRIDAGSRPGSRGPSPFIFSKARSGSLGGSNIDQQVESTPPIDSSSGFDVKV